MCHLLQTSLLDITTNTNHGVCIIVAIDLAFLVHQGVSVAYYINTNQTLLRRGDKGQI